MGSMIAQHPRPERVVQRAAIAHSETFQNTAPASCASTGDLDCARRRERTAHRTGAVHAPIGPAEATHPAGMRRRGFHTTVSAMATTATTAIPAPAAYGGGGGGGAGGGGGGGGGGGANEKAAVVISPHDKGGTQKGPNDNVSWRSYLGVFKYSRRALRLVWDTNRALAIGLAVGSLIAGVLPSGIAIVGKHLLNAILTARTSHAVADRNTALDWLATELVLVIGLAVISRLLGMMRSLL